MVKLVNINSLASEWINNPDYVYIGRAGQGLEGYFGNPIQIGKKCQICGRIHKSGGSTLACYEKYLRVRLEQDIIFREAVKALKDKILVCFCFPKKCHGEILIKYVEILNEPAFDW